MSSSEIHSWSLPPLGAVLAGGRSRRLGRNKALEEVAGKPLVQRAFDALSAVLAEVVVVGPVADTQRYPETEILPDLLKDQGPLGGLHSALHRAAGRAVFVLACDLPFVGSEVVRYLLSRPVPADSTDRVAVVPLWRGRWQPLCGIYGPGCLSRIEERLARGHRAVHGLLEDLEIREVPFGPDLDFYQPELLLNVNRVEDLEEANRYVAGDPKAQSA